MNTQIKIPEADLIQQLTGIRQALQAEKEALLARVTTIDEALGAKPLAKPVKGVHSMNTPKTSKGPGIREGVLTAVSTPMTMKEIQTLLSEHSPKSVESVVHGLVSAGQVSKDNSSPKKFSLKAS